MQLIAEFLRDHHKGNPMCASTVLRASLSLLFSLSHTSGPLPKNDITLKDVIANVRVNEELYKDIDVTYQYKYTANDDPAIKREKSTNFQPVMSGTTKTHIVVKGDLIYFSVEANRELKEGHDSYSIRHGCDGQETRMVEGATGNRHKGRVRDPRIPHANSIFFKDWHSPTPFSRFLSAKRNRQGNMRYEWTLAGEETQDGLHCIKLQLNWMADSGEAPELYMQSELWVSKERNYFPVFATHHRVFGDKRVLSGEIRADTFEQLEPNVWIPKRIRATGYDIPLALEGKKVRNNSKSWTISEVTLVPDDPQKLQELETLIATVVFPEGMLVHEISDGKITSSHVVGEENPHTSDDGTQRWALWITAGLCLVMSASMGVITYRRRQMHSPADNADS